MVDILSPSSQINKNIFSNTNDYNNVIINCNNYYSEARINELIESLSDKDNIIIYGVNIERNTLKSTTSNIKIADNLEDSIILLDDILYQR